MECNGKQTSAPDHDEFGRVNDTMELDPDKHSTCRLDPRRTLAEVSLGARDERVSPLLVEVARRCAVREEAAARAVGMCLPPLFEELEKHHLRDAAAVHRRRLRVQVDALHEGRGAGDETEAEAGGEELRERIETQHACFGVDREQRADRGRRVA